MFFVLHVICVDESFDFINWSINLCSFLYRWYRNMALLGSKRENICFFVFFHRMESCGNRLKSNEFPQIMLQYLRWEEFFQGKIVACRRSVLVLEIFTTRHAISFSFLSLTHSFPSVAHAHSKKLTKTHACLLQYIE